MDDFWDRFNDPSLLDNTYEREFGEDENPLDLQYDDDDDDDDDPFTLHAHYRQNSQTQLSNSSMISSLDGHQTNSAEQTDSQAQVQSQLQTPSQRHLQSILALKKYFLEQIADQEREKLKSQSDSHSHSQAQLQTHLQSSENINIQRQIQDKDKNKNFKFAKLIHLLKQIDMGNPVIVALIFGICIIISLSSNQDSSIMGLRLSFNEIQRKMELVINYTWLSNIDINNDLVIFIFFLFLFCLFIFVLKFLTKHMAICIGLFFLLVFYFSTNIMEYLFDLFICYFCEVISYLFCFYFMRLCKFIWFRLARWINRITRWGGIKNR